MKHKIIVDIIPEQHTGTELESEASIVISNDVDPGKFYNQVKERLLNVNGWHHLAGAVSAKFQAIDSAGKEVERPVEIGDYMRIDIPGPGSKAGDGYDWVKVEVIEEQTENEMQSIGFRVRPTTNPLSQDQSIAHFYGDSATSIFIITREGNTITASIIDRNLLPNTNPESLMDKIRDTAIGLSAIGGFAKIQWQNLADGLVH